MVAPKKLRHFYCGRFSFNCCKNWEANNKSLIYFKVSVMIAICFRQINIWMKKITRTKLIEDLTIKITIVA